MSWFKYVDGEVALPWKEWRAARKDPHDLVALTALGVRALKEAVGAEGLHTERRRVEAIAHLLHHAFRSREIAHVKGTVASLEGREPPSEPRFWDPPSLAVEAHKRLLRKSSLEPLAAQALFLGDELDTWIRPGLLRTAWILAMDGGGSGTYRDALIDPALQPRAFSFAIQGLRSGLAPPGTRGLGPAERRSMIALVEEAGTFRSGHFTPDDVIWCVRSGSFRYSEGWLELMRGTEWILVSPGELRRMLNRALRVAGVFEAEKVMLLAYFANAVGGLRPKGISIQSRGCDKKGAGIMPETKE